MGQGKRTSIAGSALAVAAGILIAMPGFSSGETVKPKLRSFEPVQARQAQAPDPTTTPPLHGTNPHGQGTVAVIDVNPNSTRPFSADPTGRTDGEDVVIGRARGEQRADGTYHGHITVAALFGNEIIAGADTGPGQQVDTGIAQDLLDQLCAGTQICLSAVRVQSATTNTGSVNRFSLASAALGNPQVPSLSIGAAVSEGNIGADANCQASRGASQVANVTSAGQVTAAVATSASDSRACRGQAPTQTNTSRVIQLGQAGLPVPAPGCDNGTPDVMTGIPGLLPIVCNADDSSATGGTQASAPYGVRDALDVYVLAVGATAAAKVSTSSSESLAVAPAAAPPDGQGPGPGPGRGRAQMTTTPATRGPATTAPDPTTTAPATTERAPATPGPVLPARRTSAPTGCRSPAPTSSSWAWRERSCSPPAWRCAAPRGDARAAPDLRRLDGRSAHRLGRSAVACAQRGCR